MPYDVAARSWASRWPNGGDFHHLPGSTLEVSPIARARIEYTKLAVAVGAAVALLAPKPSAAQAGAAPTASRRCWRGEPLPRCHRFWITEISAEYAFVSTTAHYDVVTLGSPVHSEAPDVSQRVVWTLGPMINISATRAVGATFSGGFLKQGSRFALEGRHRTWLSDRSSAVDLSPGAVRMSVPFTGAAYGLTMGGYLGRRDLAHLSLHGDLLVDGGRARAGGTVGVGAGSYVAAGATAVLGLLSLGWFLNMIRT